VGRRASLQGVKGRRKRGGRALEAGQTVSSSFILIPTPAYPLPLLTIPHSTFTSGVAGSRRGYHKYSAQSSPIRSASQGVGRKDQAGHGVSPGGKNQPGRYRPDDIEWPTGPAPIQQQVAPWRSWFSGGGGRAPEKQTPPASLYPSHPPFPTPLPPPLSPPPPTLSLPSFNAPPTPTLTTVPDLLPTPAPFYVTSHSSHTPPLPLSHPRDSPRKQDAGFPGSGFGRRKATRTSDAPAPAHC